jgi:two-component system sensor histidine kinase BaeS
MERGPVALDEVVQVAREDFETQAREHGVELDVTTFPATIDADQLRVRQVVDNLVDNAVKYSLPGGVVRVSVAPVGGSVRLVVSDDGIGVPQEELGLIFDRFFRGSNAEDHVANGTGLGLAVVAAIVHGHGGEIEATCPPGHGLTITVTFPPTSAPPAATDLEDVDDDEDDDLLGETAMMGA